MNLPYPLILASKSPRRQELLSLAGFRFNVESQETDEQTVEGLDPVENAILIVGRKIKTFKKHAIDHIVICADTIVVKNGHILGKPENEHQAIKMLKALCGGSHQVITAVAIKGPGAKEITFTEITEVIFEDLEEEEILHYVRNFKPMDKAGSYGIQEWIGLIGIKEIHGSYFNVVGLPVHRVYQQLKSLFG